MAERKILRAVRQGGKLFRTNATESEMDELEALLSSEDAKRLSKGERPSLKGFKGGRKSDQSVARARVGVVAGPARPQGSRRAGPGETEDPKAETKSTATKQPWSKGGEDGGNKKSAEEK